MTSGPKFAILGAGMSGILAAIKLGEAGLPYTVFEKADRVGGTWRENTYPGIACDVPSHIYSYSFALNPDWSYYASPGAEVQSYFESVADRYGVMGSIRFNDAVASCIWDGEAWTVTTVAGYEERFQWVIAATGILHHPKLPTIEGLGTFAGPCFHSAEWDHTVNTDGKRVGLIGTGSTGVQITGALSPTVDHLSVFQRTAQWVVPVEQIAYTEADQQRFRTDTEALREMHETLSKDFNDGFATGILDRNADLVDRIEGACRKALDAISDPELRAKVQPDYRAGCKRLVVSHNWYEAIERPNVEIVTDAIDRIEPGGVRTADGTLHELDVLVLATGFHVDRFMRPMQITGRDGLDLDDVWAEWPSAYLAVAIPGFPNFFMLNGPNSPVGNFSLIQTAELQMGYIMGLVDHVESGRMSHAEVTTEASQRFDAERVAAAKETVWATGCRSWYLDNRGIPFAWPFPFPRFRSEMAEPRLSDYLRT